MSVVGLILAAGRSARLGQPKARLPIDGVPLLTRTVQVARMAGLDVAVVFGRTIFDDLVDGADWLEVDGDAGMGATLAAATITLPPDVTRCVVIPVDLPTLDPDHLRALAAVPTPIGASRLPGGWLGAPASFAAACFPDLIGLRGDRGARDLIRSARWPVTAITPGRPLIDIDTPADWSRWQQTQEAPCG